MKIVGLHSHNTNFILDELTQIKNLSLWFIIWNKSIPTHCLGDTLRLTWIKWPNIPLDVPILGTLTKIYNMARNTSRLLGQHFESFISSEVSSGRYASASEVVRTALRLLESGEARKKSLTVALVEGEKSGFIKTFNEKEYLRKLRKKIRWNRFPMF